MGKTTRWLKGLFGMKSATSEPNSSKDRKRWGNGGSGAGICHNPATIPPNITPAEAAWLKSYLPQAGGETERNKHAVAVAAATAAAADAAVAAAQAAVEVVRLTSRGRNRNNSNHDNRNNLNRAAAAIQANFRGYLARKALRALKGLVKIQALVRGYLVRKQATATLHGMQALIRAQATVRSRRASVGPAHNDAEGRSVGPPSPGQSRRLSSSFEARTLNPSVDPDTPKVVEVDLGQPGSRSARGGTRSYSELGEDPGTYQAHLHFQSPARLAPGRLSIPNHHHHQRCCHHLHCGECGGPATTQTTPRFSGGGSEGEWGREQVYYQHPNYMAKTTSYKAKVRSVSAPKQRPDPRKRMSLSEMMEGRNSLSGVRMHRSCSHAQPHPINFKNAVMGKFGKSSNW